LPLPTIREQEAAAMTEASVERARHPAPWRGRPRVADAKGCFIAIRCTVQQDKAIREGAARAGLSVGAFLRTLAVGNPGPRSVRRPPIERAELAKLLGHVGKLGSNVNQIAKYANTIRDLPSLSLLLAMRDDIREMRDAVLKALRRGD
jgi:hypothetical protein